MLIRWIEYAKYFETHYHRVSSKLIVKLQSQSPIVLRQRRGGGGDSSAMEGGSEEWHICVVFGIGYSLHLTPKNNIHIAMCIWILGMRDQK